MMSTHEFADVTLAVGKAKKRGLLRLTGSDTKITFISPNKNPVNIEVSDITGLWWCNLGPALGYQLKAYLKSAKTLAKFSGFKEADLSKLTTWFKAVNLDITAEQVSTKGANWGDLLVNEQSNTVVFAHDNKAVFSVPLSTIQQTVVQGKNEVQLEFASLDDANNANMQPNQLLLTDIRIFIAPDEDKEKDEDEEEEQEEEEKEGDEEEEKPSAAYVLANLIQSRGDGERGTTSIAKFELMFQVPRGKYQVEMFTNHLKLYSKTFSYNIVYKTIQKMFSLPLKEANQHLFILNIHPPLRQGRTSYPYMIIAFDSNLTTEETINVDEETARDKYKGFIAPRMTGKMSEVVSRVFKALADKKVILPSKYISKKSDSPCVRCSHRAQEGHLYMLDKSFLFVKKPVLQVRYQDVREVKFERVAPASGGNNAKTFDLKIVDAAGVEYVFNSVDREEYEDLYAFLQSSGLNVETTYQELNAGVTGKLGGRPRKEADYSEDPYMRQVEAEGDDDEDSEDDSDFEAGSSDSDGNFGDSDDEDDEDLPSEVSEDDKPKKRGKKKKRDDDEEDDEEESDDDKKKKAKKAKKTPKKAKGEPKTGFSIFADENRDKVMADDESKSAADVNKEIANLWKELSDEQRNEYDEKAKQAAADEDGEETTKKTPKKKAAKSQAAGAGGNVLSVYQLFVRDQSGPLSRTEGISGKELEEKLQSMWDGYTEEDKQPYVEEHERLLNKKAKGGKKGKSKDEMAD